MKKILCIIAAVALLAALVGCGGKPEETTPPPVTESSPETSPPPSETPETPPSETPSETPSEPVETPKSVTPVTAIYTNPLDTASFYDENFFYEMNPKYKVWYVTHTAHSESAMLDAAFAHWAVLMNVEYGGIIDAGGDDGAFMDALSQCASEGANGLIIEPSAHAYASAAEYLDSAGISWIGASISPRDYVGEDVNLIHPYIAQPHQLAGAAISGKLFAIKEERWPDVPIEQIALFLIAAESPAEPPSGYILDIVNEWIDRTGLAESCFPAAITEGDTQTQITETLARAAGFPYFLIYTTTDSLAAAVNSVLDIDGLAPNSAIVSMTTDLEASRELMFKHWDNSQQNALEALMYFPTTLRAEAALGALYAFMSETATPETIWPSWINQNDKGGEDRTYATYAIPYFWLEYDNYKHIIKWTDIYSGANLFPDYPSDGITPHDYEQWRGVPEEYELQPIEPENTAE